jgi:hypothetical protein
LRRRELGCRAAPPRRTALCDLLQLGDEEVNKDRLYRGLDRLLAHKAALEAHLSQRCGELFAIQNEMLLYDVTSTYFEGEAKANPQARRGYSRDHRPDCKQVCIALVVTFDGFPLGYEVFAGNTHDSRTLQTIVATMEARHGLLGRVWITDRGMASVANLAWLRDTGRRYIIGAPKSELKKFGAELAGADGWRTVHEGVEVKLARHPETDETVIPCRSADRRSKERAMHDKFSRRIFDPSRFASFATVSGDRHCSSSHRARASLASRHHPATRCLDSPISSAT